MFEVTWEIEPGRRAVLHFMDPGVPESWKPGSLVKHAIFGWFHVMRVTDATTAVGQFVKLHVIAYGSEVA